MKNIYLLSYFIGCIVGYFLGINLGIYQPLNWGGEAFFSFPCDWEIWKKLIEQGVLKNGTLAGLAESANTFNNSNNNCECKK